MKQFFIVVVVACIAGIFAANYDSLSISGYLKTSGFESWAEVNSYLGMQKAELLVQKDQLQRKIESLSAELEAKKDMGEQKVEEITTAIENAKAAFDAAQLAIEQLDQALQEAKNAFSIEN